MNTRISLLVAAVTLAAPSLAGADDLELARKPCVYDTTDVVGYRRCPGFGTWGDNLRVPDTFLDLGTTFRHFAPRSHPAITRRAATTTPTPKPMPAGDGDTVVMFDERIGVDLTRLVYIAFDLEFGDLAAPDSRTPNDTVLVVDGLVSAGIHIGLGPVALRGEIAGGVMQAGLSQLDATTEGVLEARARADVWLTPWVTIGGVIGSSLVHDGDWMAGVFLGFHSRAYSGER